MIGHLVDFLTVVAIVFAQRHVGRRVMAFARRRWSARAIPLIRCVLIACAVAMTLGFVLSIASIGGHAPIPSWVSGWLRGAAQVWAFGSTGAYLVYLCLRPFLQRMPVRAFDPTRRRLVNGAAAAAIAVPFGAVGFGTFIQRTRFQVKEIDIPIANLPHDLEGLRLVQLSDIHLSPFLSEQEFARFVDAANQARGHVGLVTGDLISMRGDPLDACLRQLARFRAESGILGCLGNHEIYAHSERYTTEQGARVGIKFLRNESSQLRFGTAAVNFAGVDYQRIGTRHKYLVGAERLIAPDAVNILLSHNPDVFPVAERQGFNLTLAGHTHGGQVAVEILHQSINLARFFTPFVYGLYRKNRSSIYVTRGIGTIGIPARIGAPPEIAILRLRKA